MIVMRILSTLIIGCVLFLSSCSPKVSTSISKKYETLDYREEVHIFGIKDAVPANAEVLGQMKIGDSGFTTNCGWDVVISLAKSEARKIGGNAIKITSHKPPSAMGSTCHRITANILKVENFDNRDVIAVVDSSLINADYALLHIYRHGGAGSLVGYNLHLGDSVIHRVTNKSKETIKIKKDGLNTIWAKTEAKAEESINIKFGHEYYIRCGIAMGAFVGRPTIEIVDNQLGRLEFQAIEYNKSK